MAAPSIPGRDRKAIRRRPGKQMVEGKSFRLADEVRYIQRRAADRHGRVVTVGQLVLFSIETGDAWLLDRSDQLAARLARDGDPEPGHIEENDTCFVIDWKGNYRTDPAGFHVEHYVDGDLVNEDNPTRKYPFGRDTLLQWGPTFPGLSGQP